MNALIWFSIAMNAGIAFVFAWGLKRSANGDAWRRVVRDWVGSKALWLAVLAGYWAMKWIGFTASAPIAAQLAYCLLLNVFTFLHARAVVNWFAGSGRPPTATA